MGQPTGFGLRSPGRRHPGSARTLGDDPTRASRLSSKGRPAPGSRLLAAVLIPEKSVVAVATTRYNAYYQGYEWAKIIIEFVAPDGRHSVVVSANRRNKTTQNQAELVASW